MTSFRNVLADRQSTNLRILTWASVIVLLTLHVYLSLSASARMSPTYDEGVYVTGGYSYWAYGCRTILRKSDHPSEGSNSERPIHVSVARLMAYLRRVEPIDTFGYSFC